MKYLTFVSMLGWFKVSNIAKETTIRGFKVVVELKARCY